MDIFNRTNTCSCYSCARSQESLRDVFVPTVVGVLGDVESFSGFLRVDPEEDSQLFFWLVLKEKNPDTG